MKKVLFILLSLAIVSETMAQITKTHISSSKFDLQTNNSIQRRIAVHPLNKDVIITYTGGNDPTDFPKRGTGYAYFNNGSSTWFNSKGNSFTPGIDTFFAAIEVDSARVGWPNPMFIGNKEVILSHMAPTGGSVGSSNNGIMMVSRNTAGSGAWDIRRLPNNTQAETWPRAESNGDTIFVISSQSGQVFNDVNGGISFSYSTNGGSTWSANDSIKGLNPSLYAAISGDNYAVDFKNKSAVVLTGTLDVTLFKTTDMGVTWTRKSIIGAENNFQNQGENMPWKDMSDGSFSVLLDNNNVAHCFWGRQVAYAYPIGANGSISLDDSRSGIMYWNETMGNNPPILVPGTDFLRDNSKSPLIANRRFFTDNNGLFYIGGNAGYGVGTTSWPSSGIDAAGNIYLTYGYNRGIIDTTPGNTGKRIDGDPDKGYNLYDVYTMRTTNNGVTWSEPINVSKTNNLESTYPSMAKLVDDHVHIVYQEDSLYGIAFVTGASNGTGSHSGAKFINNKTMYAKVPLAEYGNTSPDITPPQISLNKKFLTHVYNTGQQAGFFIEAVFFAGCNRDTISKAVFNKSKKFFTDNIIEFRDNISNDTNNLFFIGLDTLNITTEGTKIVRIYAKDAAGNLSQDNGIQFFDTITVLIKVLKDDLPPTINIIGDNPAFAYLNSTYTDKSYAFSDNNPCTSGNVSPGVSNVNTSVKGAYTVTYKATDGAGNEATAIRNVYVGVAPTAKISDEQLTGNKLTAKGTSSLDTIPKPGIDKFTWSYKKGNQNTVITGQTKSILNYTIPSNVSSFDSVCLEVSNGLNNATTPAKPISRECKFLKYSASISSVSNALTVSVYPNPSNGEFNIKVEGNRENKARVIITSMDGKTISNSQVEINGNQIPFKSNLSKGSYFVSTEIDGQVHLEKIEVR